MAVDTPTWRRAVQFIIALAVLSTPWFALPRRVLLWASVPLFFLVPFEAFHILILAAPSTSGMIGSLLETDPMEIRDMAGSIVLPAVVSLALPALQAVLAFHFGGIRRPGPVRRGRNLAISSILVMIAAGGLAALRIADHTTTFRDSFQATFPFGTLEKAGEFAMDRFRQHQAESASGDFRWNASTPSGTTIPQTFILVIGETSRAGNWSTYGYRLPTTPHLDTSSDILRFANATSAANLTEIAIPFLLTRSTPEHPNRSDSSTSILACFREAGFKTWWISTQPRSGRLASRIGRIVDDAESRQFLTNPATGLRAFDQDLVPALEKALADPARHKLVVLHTLGSHHRYGNRYPASFARFGGRQELATYDNSILYTDHILDRILSLLRSTPGANALLYLSDHGEALGENGLHNHGRPHPVRAEVEIPFLVWVSPGLDSLRPSLLPNLRSHLRDRIWSPDLGPTLLSLAGIESPHLDRSRSLGDSLYREHVRWILTPQGDLVDADGLSGSSFHDRPAPR